jgi:hypothetical protein
MYAVYIRPVETHIRSYGNGTGGSVSFMVPDIRRTEDTAYIRSYGLGQPYTCVTRQDELGFTVFSPLLCDAPFPVFRPALCILPEQE